MLDSTTAGDISAVRDHTRELINDAGDGDEPVLIEAPPNSGKTTNAVKLALEAEKPVTYLARRIDLYEQAEETAEEHGNLRYKRIPAPSVIVRHSSGKTMGPQQISNASMRRGTQGGRFILSCSVAASNSTSFSLVLG